MGKEDCVTSPKSICIGGYLIPSFHSLRMEHLGPGTMADVPSARNVKLCSQLSADETEIPSFDLFGSIFPKPPAKRFANLSESELEELVSEQHSKKTKEVTNWCQHLKVNKKLLKLS